MEMADGSTVSALQQKVRALEQLAAEDQQEMAHELAQDLIAGIDALVHSFPAARREASPTQPASFRTDVRDTFRTNLPVESCPRCTLRSFRPQRASTEGPGVLYVCSSCGYQARLEMPG
jgi:hypothetical protein